MPDQPNSADIRRFLTEALNDEELAELCFDYFPEVHDNFTLGMTKAQKIQLLLEYCHRRKIIPNLLAAIQRIRPERYEQRFSQAAKPEVHPETAKPVHDPKQVFISHAHEDAEFAHRLAGDLQLRGWRVWIAPDSIRPGEKWVEAINRGLQESGAFILVLAPAAIKSRWVTSETNVAIGLEHRGKLRFVPLEFEQCDAPPLWDAYQRVPFCGSYENALANLLYELEPEESVRAEREKPARVEAKRQATEKAEHKARERGGRERIGAAWAQLRHIPPLVWVGSLVMLLLIGTLEIWFGDIYGKPPLVPTVTALAAVTKPSLVPSSTVALVSAFPVITPSLTSTLTLILSSTPTATATPTGTPTPTPVTPTVTRIAMSTPTPIQTPTPILASVTDIWNFRAQNISDSELWVTVDYSYNGDHGDYVWIAAEATTGGISPGSIPSRWWPARPQITRGHGSVTFKFICSLSALSSSNKCDGWTTESVWINIYSSYPPFYTKRFDFIKTWVRSKS